MYITLCTEIRIKNKFYRLTFSINNFTQFYPKKVWQITDRSI